MGHAILLLLVGLLALAAAAPKFDKDQHFGGKPFTNQAEARKAAKEVVDNPKEAWAAYKAAFKLNKLSKEDDDKRLEIFKTHASRVLEINSEPDMTWTASLNELSYLSDDELSAQFLGLIPDTNTTQRKLQEGSEGSEEGAEGDEGGEPRPARKLLQVTSACQNTGKATKCDWRAVGKVTPVKNQGQCGSCWAFGAVAAMESAYLIKKGVSADMSEQQYTDKCLYTGGGCNGGWPSTAFTYARSTPLFYDSVYKYTAYASTCKVNTLATQYPSSRYKSASNGKTIAGHMEMTPKNYQNLINYVLQGPTVIAFQVVSSFYYYNTGVYTSSTCGPQINHAMVAVGFDSAPADGSAPHFILKNSWGSGWGREGGYIRVKMVKTTAGTGLCGLYTYGARPYL